MKQIDLPETLTIRDHQLFKVLSDLPNKILRYYDIDGLSDLVLHELGHKSAFGLKRATYLVDNPDFDHLVGIAGFQENECMHHRHNIWEQPERFCSDMKNAQFHNHIKKMLHKSFAKQKRNLQDAGTIQELGEMIGMEKPAFFSWPMKHGNHGILLFEQQDELLSWQYNLLQRITALLGLCTF